MAGAASKALGQGNVPSDDGGCGAQDTEDPRLVSESLDVLELLDVQNPFVSLLCDVARAQHKEHGSGTTTMLTLAGLLSQEASRLVYDLRIPASDVARGFSEAEAACLDTADDLAFDIGRLEPCLGAPERPIPDDGMCGLAPASTDGPRSAACVGLLPHECRTADAAIAPDPCEDELAWFFDDTPTENTSGNVPLATPAAAELPQGDSQPRGSPHGVPLGVTVRNSEHVQSGSPSCAAAMASLSAAGAGLHHGQVHCSGPSSGTP